MTEKASRNTNSFAALLGLLMATALICTLPGKAALAAEQEPVTLQKYQVTGSHIKRSEVEGMLPVVTLDRTDIDRSGATTVNELFSKVIYNTAGIIDEKFTQGFAAIIIGQSQADDMHAFCRKIVVTL
jgi:iron complex outermembrane receptor protein